MPGRFGLARDPFRLDPTAMQESSENFSGD